MHCGKIYNENKEIIKDLGQSPIQSAQISKACC